MFRVSSAVCALAIWQIGFPHSAPAELPPRSISISRQFIVYGADGPLRGALCDLAERTKTAALGILNEKDAWKTAIIVNARYPQANRPELPRAHLNFSQTDIGVKLQLDLSIGGDVSADAIERELLRAIYLEMIYRQHPDALAGTAFVEPPDWLLEGTLASGKDRAPFDPTDDLRTVAASGHVITLEDFLRQKPTLLETPSQTVHRAYSAALLAMLTQTPDGPARLARFVADLPEASNNPIADLRAHFPALGDSSEAMEKRWRWSILHFSTNERFRLLDCAETERQLARTLDLEVAENDRPGAHYALEEFSRFVRLSASAKALQRLTRELVVLSGHAHPLYLPVIFEYEQITARLARRKTRRIAERLAEARSMREQISRTMQRIEDYMNWFEATQSHTASGVFRDYFKAAELALEPERRRRDPISVYLDAAEAITQD